MTHFFFFMSCVDLVTKCPTVKHKPLMAFIDAITFSHQSITNESLSSNKISDTIWITRFQNVKGWQVTSDSKSQAKLNVVYS